LTPFPTRRSSDLHQGLSGRSQARSGSSGRTGGGRRSRCPAAGSRTHHRGRPHPVGRAIPPDAPGHLWRYWLTHLGPASCPRGLDSDGMSGLFDNPPAVSYLNIGFSYPLCGSGTTATRPAACPKAEGTIAAWRSVRSREPGGTARMDGSDGGPSSVLLFVALIGLVLASAFFSGSEVALLSANRLRLRHLSEQGNRRARAVLDLLEHPQR